MKGLLHRCLWQPVLVVFTGIALSIATLLVQASPQLAPNHPDAYTVVMDDTLWDISARFLKQPWMWPEIWQVNPQIKNPHLIYPGDEIRLIYVNGEPRLTVKQRQAAFRTREKILPNGTVKLSPRVRSSKLEEAIPTIPLDIVHAFLSRNRIVYGREMKKAPYVVMGQEQRILLGAGDKLYARGNIDRNLGNYGIFRLGKPIKHPITGERLGFEGVGIGKVTASAFGDSVSTFRVTDSFEEIRLGDRLLPQSPSPIHSMFYPKPPSNDHLFGKVVGINDSLKRAGRFEVVTISLGEREGITVGNVFSIFSSAVRIKDPVKGGTVTLPEEPIGLLMVFNTFEKVSYALVMEASRPVEIGSSLYHPNADVDDRKSLIAAIDAAHKQEKQKRCKPRRFRNGKRIERCDTESQGVTWLVDAMQPPKAPEVKSQLGVKQGPNVKPLDEQNAESVRLQPVAVKPKDVAVKPEVNTTEPSIEK